jgi:hypothetical protein
MPSLQPALNLMMSLMQLLLYEADMTPGTVAEVNGIECLIVKVVAVFT